MAKKVKKTKRKSSKKMTILPRKMSSLIGIALKDIRKAEKLPNKFVIDMMTWYDPNKELVCRLGSDEWSPEISRSKVCVMCAAGSVLAFSLGAGGNIMTSKLSALEAKNENQLGAIDYLRGGDVEEAGNYLGIPSEKIKKYFKVNKFKRIPNYEIENPEPFHKAMLELKTKLAKAGL